MRPRATAPLCFPRTPGRGPAVADEAILQRVTAPPSRFRLYTRSGTEAFTLAADRDGPLEGEGEAVNKAKADFYLVGPVFRCLFLRTEEIPEDELAFGIEAVSDEDLVIPEEIEEVEEEEEYIEPDEPPQIESEEEEEKKEEAAQEEGDASSDAKENTKNQETPEATPAGEEA